MNIQNISHIVEKNNFNDAKILFIADFADICKSASTFISILFPNTETIFWQYGTIEIPDLLYWNGDYIVSFKSDLILNQQILSQALYGAFNFHPSPPKYRGIGGEYYAIWNGDQEFGATCHVMDGKLDHGPIINIIEFPIEPADSAESIKFKADRACLELLMNFLTCVVDGRKINYLNRAWGETLYTRKMLTAEKQRRHR
jgi:phosphoribosylglycinamide formyltransferase 1